MKGISAAMIALSLIYGTTPSNWVGCISPRWSKCLILEDHSLSNPCRLGCCRVSWILGGRSGRSCTWRPGGRSRRRCLFMYGVNAYLWRCIYRGDHLMSAFSHVYSASVRWMPMEDEEVTLISLVTSQGTLECRYNSLISTRNGREVLLYMDLMDISYSMKSPKLMLFLDMIDPR